MFCSNYIPNKLQMNSQILWKLSVYGGRNDSFAVGFFSLSNRWCFLSVEYCIFFTGSHRLLGMKDKYTLIRGLIHVFAFETLFW